MRIDFLNSVSRHFRIGLYPAALPVTGEEVLLRGAVCRLTREV